MQEVAYGTEESVRHGRCSTRKVFDKETVRQFRMSLGWVLSDNFRAGQFLCRTCTTRKFSTISDVVRLGFVRQLPRRTTGLSNTFGVEHFPLSRELSDTAVVRHESCPTKPNLTTPEIVEQFPCRTLSESNTFLRPNFRVGQLPCRTISAFQKS